MNPAPRTLEETPARPTRFNWRESETPWFAAAVILVAIAVFRIVSTYSVFTETYDEPYHIGGGMEWLQTDRLSQFEDPPLGQIAVALGLYLGGHRLPSDLALAGTVPGTPKPPRPWVIEKGNSVLLDGDYWKNLEIARLGTVPFFCLACAVVFLWTRRWFSVSAAFWALLLFTNLPPVLGHAALATVDLAGVATGALALYAFLRWLEMPSWRWAAALGAALSLAFLSKLSNLAFLGLCFATAFAWGAVRKQIDFQGPALRRRAPQALIAVCAMLPLLWAGYRFNTTPLSAETGAHKTIDRRFANRPLLRKAAYAVVEFPVPLKEMENGIRVLIEHNKLGHDSYIFGRTDYRGWWYFFPVVFGVKTPIGFLLLTFAGIAAALWKLRSGSWQRQVTALFPIVILLFCMRSHIDLGVRHILLLYLLCAPMAGFAVSMALRRRSVIAIAALLAVCAVLADAWRAHPDYMAWFNQFGGDHPEKILVESDLDWGQDLHRLSTRLSALGIRHVAIRYFGVAPLDRAGLPDYTLPAPNERVTGYYAVSLRYTTMESARGTFEAMASKGYGWLKAYKPIERIGKSIDLYYIAPDSTHGASR